MFDRIFFGKCHKNALPLSPSPPKLLCLLSVAILCGFGLLPGHLRADNLPDQQAFPILVERVLIFGNEKTKEEVILREIPFTFPAELDLDDLQLIQNRLTNLFLFNRVELGLLGEGPGKILIIQLTETWYIYPVPLFFINERDWDKLSYGFSLTHYNFRGMHERLTAGGWLGYNPSFFIHYHNPWLGKKSRFIFGIDTFGKRVGNKFFDFDEHHLLGRITLGKRLSLNASLQFTASLRRISLPEEYKQYSVSGTGTDLIPKFSLQYLVDKRDLVEYPREGYLVQWVVTRAGLSARQPNFWRFKFDHRLYLKLHERFTLAGRNFLTLTSRDTDEIPIYDRIFIGFLNRIRGYFNTVLTGQNLMTHHLEARISLIPVRYLSWKDAPVFPVFFQQLKYGLSLGLFVDSGIVWDEPRELSLRNHLSGYGVGLHIHLPYIYVLRIDHAWNDRGRPQWIIEAGFIF